jgi:hypothetical protein
MTSGCQGAVNERRPWEVQSRPWGCQRYLVVQRRPISYQSGACAYHWKVLERSLFVQTKRPTERTSLAEQTRVGSRGESAEGKKQSTEQTHIRTLGIGLVLR